MPTVRLGCALLAFAGSALAAEPPTPSALRDEVRPYLVNALPTVEAIVGIAMPAAAPMLVVASFGDDGAVTATDRGYVIGRAPNELLFGAHPALDVENPTYYAFDTSDRGVVVGIARDSRANAYRVARREAAQWCVHGRVESDPARVDVIVDRCSEAADARRRRFDVASEAGWPAALDAMCGFVVESTGVASPAQAAPACARAQAMRPASIMAYARFAASGGMTIARLESLVSEDPSFVPAVVELLDRMPYDGDWRAFVDRRKRLVAGAGASPAVIHTALSRHLAIYGWKLDKDVYEPMFAFIRAHPQLRSGWLLLASRLAEGTPHDHRPAEAPRDSYHPNETTQSAALSISLAYYATWPRSYRARWQTGYALMQYAWMLRGNSTWDKVPVLGRASLRPLMGMAEPLIAEALAIQPNSPILWENRVRTLYHVGGDWRGAFDASIERLPRARNLYEAAMEFSQPRWGGKPADIERVESLARKHNPGESWVATLRSRHGEKTDS